MISAILYTSNSGFTGQYADLLAERTGLPAYNIKNSIPPAVLGKEVIYLGWLMAGGIKGYAKTAKAYDVKAVCGVGMTPPSAIVMDDLRKNSGVPDQTKLFYLHGGFDINKLSGLYKWVMKLMCKKIRADLESIADRTPEQEITYQMTLGAASSVDAENLNDIVAWYQTQAQ